MLRGWVGEGWVVGRGKRGREGTGSEGVKGE